MFHHCHWHVATLSFLIATAHLAGEACEVLPGRWGVVDVFWIKWNPGSPRQLFLERGVQWAIPGDHVQKASDTQAAVLLHNPTPPQKKKTNPPRTPAPNSPLEPSHPSIRPPFERKNSPNGGCLALIFQFPIYWEPSSQLSIYQVYN